MALRPGKEFLMASEPAKQGGQTLSTVLNCLKIFALNSYRRLLIVGHYAMICLHQQRLRRAWRLLGKHIHQAVEAGEDNPMLGESVQEKLNRAEVVKGTKERHYQAIADLREKIQTCREEVPSPAATESPAAAEAAPETEAGKEEGQA
jgi:gas vesicle protein